MVSSPSIQLLACYILCLSGFWLRSGPAHNQPNTFDLSDLFYKRTLVHGSIIDVEAEQCDIPSLPGDSGKKMEEGAGAGTPAHGNPDPLLLREPAVPPDLPLDFPLKVNGKMFWAEIKAGVRLGDNRFSFAFTAPLRHAWISVIGHDEPLGHYGVHQNRGAALFLLIRIRSISVKCSQSPLPVISYGTSTTPMTAGMGAHDPVSWHDVNCGWIWSINQTAAGYRDACILPAGACHPLLH